MNDRLICLFISLLYHFFHVFSRPSFCAVLPIVGGEFLVHEVAGGGTVDGGGDVAACVVDFAINFQVFVDERAPPFFVEREGV